MRASHQPDPKGQAVAWLATCFVLVAGSVACTFIAVAMQADASRIWKYAGPLGLAFVALMWMLRDRRREGVGRQQWQWLSRRSKAKTQVRLARVAPPTPPATIPLAPPTAETVRELKEGLNTWVPANRGTKSNHR